MAPKKGAKLEAPVDEVGAHAPWRHSDPPIGVCIEEGLAHHFQAYSWELVRVTLHRINATRECRQNVDRLARESSCCWRSWHAASTGTHPKGFPATLLERNVWDISQIGQRSLQWGGPYSGVGRKRFYQSKKKY